VKPLNLSGKRFGKLEAIERKGIDAQGRALWECRCDCGNTVEVRAVSLTTKNTKSCGCLAKELVGNRSTTHGACVDHKRTKEYRSWRNAMNRCYYQKSNRYTYYGARGISMCDRWRNSFEKFLSDMGRCPAGKTLDRKDNDGNYEPGNCRWATSSEQRKNRRDYVGRA